MKALTLIIRFIFTFFLIVICIPDANAQVFKKLKKKAEKAAERTVERRVEKESSKKTDQVLDSILEPGKKGKTPTDKDGNPIPGGQNPNNTGRGNDNSNTTGEGGPKTIQIYSKFDYVPGDKLLFFDDFDNDFVGDFPSKWNTNGSGEVVTINDSPQKWLKILPGHSTYYIPDVPSLPEEYTIEFDILATGLDRQTSSTATLQVELSANNTFKAGDAYAYALIPFCQYSPIGVRVRNYDRQGGGSEINNVVNADLRQTVLNQPHVSIAVNKQRFRMWINERKYVDIPRMIPAGNKITALKFHLNTFKDGKENLFISNLKVAEGGLDLRRTLIADGRVSTNGILFDSGSANIQPQSMGIIRQISQVLQQERDMNLNIIGHTDADGNDAANMDLSKSRANAVKDALVNVYNIDAARLSTDGKGESEPVGDNTTTDGKAQNRRVEFVKQ
ncbi:OmpA family protein [Muriicola sp. Z0-33]|uniref:OmpA family protein n=1 Tax=Muriicola sp. Z0-33 TaxID=2816957 RepID=UPI002238CAC0|nr:OmpA family protein [Muriicola sp. Z0-33]MCW5517898.1 OmpA family protein [Muriicola sp. Z0-33]